MRRLAVAALVTLVASPARAESPAEAVDATIVRVEEHLAYFDGGARTGLRPGAVLRVLRTVSARHPVSGQTVTDHFPVGVLTVLDVGEVLSYGKLDRRLAAIVTPGDLVRIRADPPSPPSAPGPAPPAAPPEAVEIAAVWRSTLGKQPGERARILESHLEKHPDTPFARPLEREIAAFQAMESRLEEAERRAVAAEETLADRRRRATPRVEALAIQGALPERLAPGDPFEVAIFTRAPDRVAAAFAYARRPDDLTYQRIALAPDGDGYFRGRIPDALVAPPGIDVFVEVVDRRGVPVTAGTAGAPTRIPVEAPATGPVSPGPGRSAVRVFFEAVDFNRFRGNDFYLVSEVDVLYRIGRTLYSVRTGFGVLRGIGGNVADLDAHPCDRSAVPPDPACGHTVGMNYGYVEGELRFGRLIGLAARLLAGQTYRGPGAGAELRLRIGPETGTNLVIGGSVLSDVGAHALLALEWDVIRRWPMSATVIVTNQPAGENVGVRFVYQIAFRARSWLQPALRVGYGARNIDYGGLSVGLGLVMGW